MTRTFPSTIAAASLAAFALASIPAPALAGTACDVSSEREFSLADRKDELARLQQQPDHCLKTVFMRCSLASEQRLLETETAFACSMAYEALLKKSFEGDFKALLAWWQSTRTPQAN